MEIGDKVKIVVHSFYSGRYGRIVDKSTNGVPVGSYLFKVMVDIDGNVIWVTDKDIVPANQNQEESNEDSTASEDSVRSPYYDEHYRNMKVQPIELAQDLLTPEEMIGAMKFNIIKYSLRAGTKDGEPAGKDETKKERYREWLKTLYDGKRIELWSYKEGII